LPVAVLQVGELVALAIGEEVAALELDRFAVDVLAERRRVRVAAAAATAIAAAARAARAAAAAAGAAAGPAAAVVRTALALGLELERVALDRDGLRGLLLQVLRGVLLGRRERLGPFELPRHLARESQHQRQTSVHHVVVSRETCARPFNPGGAFLRTDSLLRAGRPARRRGGGSRSRASRDRGPRRPGRSGAAGSFRWSRRRRSGAARRASAAALRRSDRRAAAAAAERRNGCASAPARRSTSRGGRRRSC